VERPRAQKKFWCLEKRGGRKKRRYDRFILAAPMIRGKEKRGAKTAPGQKKKKAQSLFPLEAKKEVDASAKGDSRKKKASCFEVGKKEKGKVGGVLQR